MKTAILMLFGLLLSVVGMADTVLTVSVGNSSETDRTDEPVVIDINGYAPVKSATVTLDGTDIPCQIDDLDGDKTADELCFLADVKAGQTLSYTVTLSPQAAQKVYTPRVYAEMLLSNKKVKETNKQNLYISGLTVENGVNAYWMIHHHGAAFENELVAYRIYFDHRQTVDIYGKYRKGLELKDTQFYPDDEQKAAGYGDDVLWVGSTFGLGALRGWDGQKPTMLEDVAHRTQRIVATGPLRTIIEVKDEGWTPQPNNYPLDMTTLYTLYAGQRDCRVDISFDHEQAVAVAIADETGDKQQAGLFSTGIINVKGSTEYTDHEGLRACWGTDWPVSAKDSVGHKRETVGLGIYIPKQYIASEQPADKDNYAFIVKPDDNNRLSYRITFASDNETFGPHSDNEWFDLLKAWRRDVEQPLSISIR